MTLDIREVENGFDLEFRTEGGLDRVPFAIECYFEPPGEWETEGEVMLVSSAATLLKSGDGVFRVRMTPLSQTVPSRRNRFVPEKWRAQNCLVGDVLRPFSRAGATATMIGVTLPDHVGDLAYLHRVAATVEEQVRSRHILWGIADQRVAHLPRPSVARIGPL